MSHEVLLLEHFISYEHSTPPQIWSRIFREWQTGTGDHGAYWEVFMS